MKKLAALLALFSALAFADNYSDAERFKPDSSNIWDPGSSKSKAEVHKNEEPIKVTVDFDPNGHFSQLVNLMLIEQQNKMLKVPAKVIAKKPIKKKKTAKTASAAEHGLKNKEVKLESSEGGPTLKEEEMKPMIKEHETSKVNGEEKSAAMHNKEENITIKNAKNVTDKECKEPESKESKSEKHAETKEKEESKPKGEEKAKSKSEEHGKAEEKPKH